MQPVRHAVEIDRSPDDVFAFVTDATRWPEWQEGVRSVVFESEGGMEVGAVLLTRRRLGPRKLTIGLQVVALDAPRAYELRGLTGLVRASRGSLESLDGGSRTRLTAEVEFDGHGIARLLVPLVIRRQASGQLQRSQRTLKRMLERPATESNAVSAG